jgi:hypothetical protein
MPLRVELPKPLPDLLRVGAEPVGQLADARRAAAAGEPLVDREPKVPDVGCQRAPPPDRLPTGRTFPSCACSCIPASW